jgi:hypothetical protein
MTFLATHFSLVLGAWRFRVRIDIDEPPEDAIAEPASQRHRSAERAAAILQRSPLLMLVALLMAIATPLIAYAQMAPVHRPPLECDATRAHLCSPTALLKKLAERARRAAHARVVRVIEPGMMYTMEFDRSRLSVYADRRGMVTSVKCE